MRKNCLLVAAIVVSLSSLAPSLSADDAVNLGLPHYLQQTPENSSSEIVSLDGKQISKAQAINTFLQATITRHIGGDDPFPNLLPVEQRRELLLNKNNIETHYPWMYQYLFPGKDEPNFSGVNKWTKPITISIGFPNDLMPYNPPLYKGKPVTDYPEWPSIIDEKKQIVETIPAMPKAYTSEINEEAEALVIEEIKTLVPILANLTGLGVEFVDQEPKDPSLVSNMRIVLLEPSDARWWISKFKKGPISTNYAFRSLVEYFFKNAIHFTPIYGPYQVDGYFIPNAKNEIQFSVCYIRTDHDEVLLENLVKECLIRSLGFPEVQRNFKNSYTSNWNIPDIEQSKLKTTYDQLKQLYGEEYAKLFLSSPAFSLLGITTRESSFDNSDNASFSEQDKYLVKTLYSPSVKPGMNKSEVFDALNNQ